MRQNGGDFSLRPTLENMAVGGCIRKLNQARKLAGVHEPETIAIKQLASLRMAFSTTRTVSSQSQYASVPPLYRVGNSQTELSSGRKDGKT